jgi:hypothetical protein
MLDFLSLFYVYIYVYVCMYVLIFMYIYVYICNYTYIEITEVLTVSGGLHAEDKLQRIHLKSNKEALNETKKG